MTKDELIRYSVLFDMILDISPKLFLLDKKTGDFESYYKYDENTIFIDNRYLNETPLSSTEWLDIDIRLISALAHEKRHAYQYKNLTPKWKEEFDLELDPVKDKESYLQQDIEIDARAFSVMIQSRLFLKYRTVEELIRDRVVNRANDLYDVYVNLLDASLAIISPPGKKVSSTPGTAQGGN